MLRLLLEEIFLFFTLLFVVLLSLFDDRVDSIDFSPEPDYLLLLLSFSFLELRFLLD